MQTLTLLHSESFPIGRYAAALEGQSIASRSVDDLGELLAGDSSSLRVLLVDRGILDGGSARLLLDPRTAVVGVGIEEQPSWLTADSVYLQLPESPAPAVLANAVKRAFQFLYQKQRADHLERQLTERTRE